MALGLSFPDAARRLRLPPPVGWAPPACWLVMTYVGRPPESAHPLQGLDGMAGKVGAEASAGRGGDIS